MSMHKRNESSWFEHKVVIFEVRSVIKWDPGIISGFLQIIKFKNFSIRNSLQIMAKVLQCFDNIPDLADKLLEGNDDLLKLVSPSVASVLEKALLQPVLHPQHVC